jgi:hypothetical protein
MRLVHEEARSRSPRLQEAAEKLFAMVVLKGRGFSRAAEALYFCHSERLQPRGILVLVPTLATLSGAAWLSCDILQRLKPNSQVPLCVGFHCFTEDLYAAFAFTACNNSSA